ncbi:hypothetical protein LzC2_40540 [Planctomycetes bacterium LzC2]|uniref:Uncharacterized protein n=1 Tax=Alienimonas chondri TaxID=2681879 RepID=A0ABX1VIK0_9PLAN|nr:hypothetical protein [Alienimonas chondri]
MSFGLCGGFGELSFGGRRFALGEFGHGLRGPFEGFGVRRLAESLLMPGGSFQIRGGIGDPLRDRGLTLFRARQLLPGRVQFSREVRGGDDLSGLLLERRGVLLRLARELLRELGGRVLRLQVRVRLFADRVSVLLRLLLGGLRSVESLLRGFLVRLLPGGVRGGVGGPPGAVRIVRLLVRVLLSLLRLVLRVTGLLVLLTQLRFRLLLLVRGGAQILLGVPLLSLPQTLAVSFDFALPALPLAVVLVNLLTRFGRGLFASLAEGVGGLLQRVASLLRGGGEFRQRGVRVGATGRLLRLVQRLAGLLQRGFRLLRLAPIGRSAGGVRGSGRQSLRRLRQVLEVLGDGLLFLLERLVGAVQIALNVPLFLGGILQHVLGVRGGVRGDLGQRLTHRRVHRQLVFQLLQQRLRVARGGLGEGFGGGESLFEFLRGAGFGGGVLKGVAGLRDLLRRGAGVHPLEVLRDEVQRLGGRGLLFGGLGQRFGLLLGGGGLVRGDVGGLGERFLGGFRGRIDRGDGGVRVLRPVPLGLVGEILPVGVIGERLGQLREVRLCGGLLSGQFPHRFAGVFGGLFRLLLGLGGKLRGGVRRRRGGFGGGDRLGFRFDRFGDGFGGLFTLAGRFGGGAGEFGDRRGVLHQHGPGFGQRRGEVRLDRPQRRRVGRQFGVRSDRAGVLPTAFDDQRLRPLHRGRPAGLVDRVLNSVPLAPRVGAAKAVDGVFQLPLVGVPLAGVVEPAGGRLGAPAFPFTQRFGGAAGGGEFVPRLQRADRGGDLPQGERRNHALRGRLCRARLGVGIVRRFFPGRFVAGFLNDRRFDEEPFAGRGGFGDGGDRP